MQPATGARLLELLRAEIAAPTPRATFEVPVARYLDPAHLARETTALFATTPRVVAASRDLAPGACMPVGPALLVRAADGTLRAFRNACRHRATRLVDAPCAAKALVCPYHGWTYGLDGALLHVPHADTFDASARRGLDELAVAERHGLVWLGTADARSYLGDVDADLAALGLADHVTWKTARVRRRCNWKLVVEAFLDGYHIRVLHRDSILYRFFLDAASAAEHAPPHIRAVTPRRTLRAAGPDPIDLRALATPSLQLFPATTVIVHPDFVSLVRVDPVSPGETDYSHAMLVPADRATDAEREHWDRSWTLIEETVFQREDLWVCEQVQLGLAAAPPGDTVRFGALEHAASWFHGEIDARLAAAT